MSIEEFLAVLAEALTRAGVPARVNQHELIAAGFSFPARGYGRRVYIGRSAFSTGRRVAKEVERAAITIIQRLPERISVDKHLKAYEQNCSELRQLATDMGMQVKSDAVSVQLSGCVKLAVNSDGTFRVEFTVCDLVDARILCDFFQDRKDGR